MRRKVPKNRSWSRSQHVEEVILSDSGSEEDQNEVRKAAKLRCMPR